MKKSRFRLVIGAATLGLLITFLAVGIAAATVITVDGDPTDWPGDPTCTPLTTGCALLVVDPSESITETDRPAGADITTFWGTNSVSTAYFRYDTEGNTTDYSNGELTRICINHPNETPGQSNVGGCSSLSVDRMILVYDFGTVEVRAYDCNSVNCNSFFATPVATGVYSVNMTVNEISLPLSSLGITSTHDGLGFATLLYFDNNNSPRDDSVPDTGTITWTVGTDSPTVITLSELEARPTPDYSAALVGITIGLFIAVAFLFWRRRRLLT